MLVRTADAYARPVIAVTIYCACHSLNLFIYIFGHTDSVVVPQHVESQMPDQESTPCPLHWKVDS